MSTMTDYGQTLAMLRAAGIHFYESSETDGTMVLDLEHQDTQTQHIQYNFDDWGTLIGIFVVQEVPA